MRLIDADEIIKILGIKQEEWDMPDERWRSEREFGSVIMNMPTIEAEPVRHGFWIFRQETNSQHEHLECSECGQVGFIVTNYCHCCGAKMDLED